MSSLISDSLNASDAMTSDSHNSSPESSMCPNVFQYLFSTSSMSQSTLYVYTNIAQWCRHAYQYVLQKQEQK